jgi:(R,R)-butanediol dehydrogenase/meso-butanediol dehydrogenase/diacetyl reductase
MRAAVYKGKQELVIEDLPLPEPGAGEILVKVSHSAICGTDVHAFLYDIAPPGTVMGHEFSGTVAAVGPGVTMWKEGDRIIGGGGTPPPGSEAPLRRQEQYNYRLEGFADTRKRGYAEFTLLNDWAPLSIPDNVSDLKAALTEPCSVAVRAVRLSNMKLGDVVAVLGAGPIGLLTMQAARAAGARKIIVSEPSATRRDTALQLGADAVVNPSNEDVISSIVNLAEGDGPHVVFECAAAPSTLDAALNMVRKKGSVMLVALAWENVPLLPVDWAGKEIQLNTTFGAEPYDWKVALDLISNGKVDLEPMLLDTDILTLDGIQEAFEALVKPSTQVQMVVRF